MPTPSPLVVRESGHGAAATRSGVDEQYASRHSARLHCPARDCRRSCRVVRGFAVRAAAASARAWRRLPARHCAPSMQWRALPRPARWSISAWSPSQDLNGPAASITAPARSARSFATDTTARPAVLSTIALRRHTIARPLSGGASASTAMRQATIADPCWYSIPPLRPNLRTGIGRAPRGPDGDRRAAASRPRSRSRRRSPPTRGGRSRPAGPPTAEANVPARRRARSVRSGRCSPSPQPRDSGAN